MGLWMDGVPPDHFAQANNIQYFNGGFKTRDGIDLYQSLATSLGNILRIHPYRLQTGLTLLVLDSGGNIHHVVSPTSVFNNILSIGTMTDFNTVSIAGRAYITPFFTDANGTEKGISGQFLYVYLGAGVVARKAAGPTAAGAVVAANGAAGLTDAGVHVFGVVGETDTGYLSPPTALSNFTTSATFSVSFSSVPLFTGSFWTKRHIVASVKIIDFNGNLDGYQLFFIPNATINDNTTTTLANISFFDADLIDDASHLLDNFTEIPAGVGLTVYHGRLVLTTTFSDISIAYVSSAGEPEAINQVDGLLIVPLDGNPLTNCQVFRDETIGAPGHGVATVLDSGGVNVDYLLVAGYNGIMLFNGSYVKPALTQKVRDFWLDINRTLFREIEIINNSISEHIYIVMPDGTVLYGDYENGLGWEDIKWSIWSFNAHVTTLEIINTVQIIIGSKDL
jgi:hypothetical protein